MPSGCRTEFRVVDHAWIVRAYFETAYNGEKYSGDCRHGKENNQALPPCEPLAGHQPSAADYGQTLDDKEKQSRKEEDYKEGYNDIGGAYTCQGSFERPEIDKDRGIKFVAP